MRAIIVFVVLIPSLSLRAQTALSISPADSIQQSALWNNSHTVESKWDKKWSFSTYRGISTSFQFFNGGNAVVVAAPMGLQLNRRLNNNLYAFTGLSVAPAYTNFNRSFLSSDINKVTPGNGFFRSNSFGVYSRAELGLMYVNDARTFSISGSIGVQRSSSPLFPYQQVSPARPNAAARPNK